MWEPVGQDSDLLAEISVALPDRGGSEPAIADRSDCLEQILEAFCDIADRDDIHQAAARLRVVQDWIKLEAARAAADPIFRDPELAH